MAIGKNISLNLKENLEENNKILEVLGDYFYNKIFKLQHPQDCKIARFLVCRLEQFCGFGCVMHHISFCLSIAMGTNRTLIFEDDGIKWSYNVRWNDIFEPITNCNYGEDIAPWLPINNYKDISARIERQLFLDRRSDIPFEVNYQPEVLPKEFSEILFTQHSNPSLWFHGQKWTDFWFDLENIKLLPLVKDNKNNLNKTIIQQIPRRIFIATEEPKIVIKEAKKHWNDKYEIFYNKLEAKYGFEEGDPIRYTKDSLLAIMAEIKILVQCQFVVCTFSSNVCRLIYELMQTVQAKDMSEAVQSLDVYYTETWKC
ncbi:unnamed protein product [Meloidogyne enterolobii]|uniref:Uncharacterized protein n=1 Tax=Meloidogyne enterolobii TaxID=390850 RepID=A0ACB0YFT3_MELEN